MKQEVSKTMLTTKITGRPKNLQTPEVASAIPAGRENTFIAGYSRETVSLANDHFSLAPSLQGQTLRCSTGTIPLLSYSLLVAIGASPEIPGGTSALFARFNSRQPSTMKIAELLRCLLVIAGNGL